MNIKIEIDDDIADKIVIESMKNMISMLEESVSHLQKRKKLLPYEKENLINDIKGLDAFKTVLEWYEN